MAPEPWESEGDQQTALRNREPALAVPAWEGHGDDEIVRASGWRRKERRYSSGTCVV
jgi:hypothetical protein